MKWIKSLQTLILITAVSLLGFTACDVSDSPNTRTMQVQLTDAPADLDAVYVDIQSVRVHRNSTAETDPEETDEEAEQDGWVTILDEPMRVNLLDLQNGNEITLGETELEAGTYSQMRFILGNDNEVVIDGQSHNLITPSGQQSGLKLLLNTSVEEGQTLTLLVDFDAARSVVHTGNDRYLLKPVLRVAELAETGTLSGAVDQTGFQTDVFAIQSEDTLGTMTDENTGAFVISGVAPGDYDVLFQPKSDQYADTTVAGVSVQEGDTTDMGTIELPSSSN